MKTTPTQHIHCKSDFSLLFRFAEGRPDCPWDLTFSTDGRFLSSSFSCSFDGQKYTHCAPVEGTADGVLIAFDNHRLGSGPLTCRLHRAQPDALFTDGVRDLIDPLSTSVVLWEGPSDAMTTPPEVTALLLPMLTGPAGPSAYAAAAANGYPGDEASFNADLAAIAGKADSPKSYSTTVNTPAWTLQPTIEGALNTAFVAHPEDFYFVTLRAADGEALPAGQFRLTPSLDAAYAADPAKAIDQTFTLAGLQTGNNGVLKESLPVDFLAVGEAWRMRSGGVTSVQINIEEQYRKDYDLSVVACIRPTRIYYGYYSIFYPNAEGDYFTFSEVGTGYHASAPGFLFRPNTYNYRKHNISIETCHFLRIPNSWVADYTRGVYAYNGTLSNRLELINTNGATIRTNGCCFSVNPAKTCADLNLTNFNYESLGMWLLNGSSIVITLKKR